VNAELKIGFLVNPVAGMGGRVGLKGTDRMSKDAAALGAKPIAPTRAVDFLKRLKELKVTTRIDLITCPGIMGKDEATRADLEARVLPVEHRKETGADDTKSAVKLMAQQEVDLIAFVGGDGTARDVLDALSGAHSPPVLGVPSGVKMYSGVFAASPRDAADIVGDFLDGSTQLMDFEVMDTDEKAVRSDRLKVSLHGFLKGPYVPMRFLGSKQVSPETADEHESQVAVARFIVEEMNLAWTYILGPGTTTKCVADLLGIGKTLLGVDLYQHRKVVKDVNEQKILQAIKDWSKTWIILSPIGRQGMLLGRGNQQISPEIIKRVGKDHLIVAATKSKIQGIEGGVLRIDTGDPEVDKMLRGYIKVATEYREWRLMKIV